MPSQVAIQVLVSALIVAGVLFAMWCLPRRGDALLPWASPLALGSAWLGLVAAVLSAMLWVLPYPDRWLLGVFLLFDPGAVAAGVLVLWLHRGDDSVGAVAEGVAHQRVQARVGIALGLLAVALGYVFVMSHKSPGSAVGQ